MPHFYERYYSLDLKKSAEFGPSKEVYTLRCRLLSYGAEKESRNLILTPGRDANKNFTQWNSLQKLLREENALIFSFDILKQFFPSEEFGKFIKSLHQKTLEIKKIAELFIQTGEFYNLDDLNAWLNSLFPPKGEEESHTPELTLEKMARFVIGFDPLLRRSLTSLLSPMYPLIADWLDSLKEQKRGLPEAFLSNYPHHFVKFEENDPLPQGMESDEKLEAVFANGGRLGNLLSDYEYRREQAKMAKLFTRAIRNSEFFVAEAGTGTGKSLAYTVPAILHVTETGSRAVVATYTRTLQTQLLFNDLPLAAAACGRAFTSALLKGRSNYLCLLKKAMLKSRAVRDILPEDYFNLAKVEIWESLTNSGDLAEINIDNQTIIRQISAEANFCLRQACQFYNKCYFFKARKQASRASVTIVNQALFFTDMLAESSIIGDRDLVVFDEAHRLEKTATSHLGGELDRFYALSALNNLYLRREKEKSSLVMTEDLLKRVLPGDANFPFEYFGRLQEETEGSRMDLNQLFDDIKSFQEAKGYRADTFTFKKTFDNESPFFRYIADSLRSLEGSLQKLVSSLTDLYSEISDLKLEQDNLIRMEELNRSLGELSGIFRAVATLSECDSQNFVFWQEISERGFSKLAYAPLDVGPELKNQIYSKYPSILFTSASLSVEGYFDFFEKSIGLNLLHPEQVIRKSFGSSFDFFSQIEFSCPVYLPSPKLEYYSRALASFILKVVPILKKKTLVLCTSNQLLTELYQQTSRGLQAAGFEVLGQSLSGTAEQVLAAFRRARMAVIFGTDSFWEGIDLPGTQLEVLIITRLPFATPTDPIEAARMDMVEKAGENSFASYSLPNAVLKFKQGFGRLIRQKTDRGYIIVTDNRLFKSNFGQIFLNSVPAELNVVYSQEDFIDKLDFQRGE